MIEITGKYGTAKVYVKDFSKIEDDAVKLVYNFLNSEAAKNTQVRIMPDVHCGKGVNIGTTIKYEDRVVPATVGCDIGCGMEVVKLSKDVPIDLKNLDKVCRQRVPMGMKGRKTKHKFCDNVHLEDLITDVSIEQELLKLGSLGSGNHFLELDVDDEGNKYLVIHSGSRHLGIVIESFYTKKAIAYHENKTKLKDTLIAKLKAEGREKEISAELAKIDNPKVNRDLAYLEGELLEDYIHDMKIAQEYAYWNRKAMQAEILDALNIKRKDILDSFCTMHNYIDIENKIIRKGAISLQRGELALIPMNMSDGALIVRGKGNPDWNFSGPHGAGRLMSRTAAKEKLRMEDFKESMKGIYTTSVSVATIDESKMAYKPMQDIIDNIQDTCDIIMRIKPIWNIKASD